MLHSAIPESFTPLKYAVYLSGRLCQIEWKGRGRYFENIYWNQKRVHSAVIFEPVEKILVTRGIPDEPYLAEVNSLLQQINYNRTTNELRMHVKATRHYPLKISIIVAVGFETGFPEW